MNVQAPWTAEEDERLIAAYRANRSPEDIGLEIGRTRSSVSHRLSRLRCKGLCAIRPQTNRYKPIPTFWTGERDQILIDGRRARKTAIVISQQLGVSESSVRARISKLRSRGVEFPSYEKEERIEAARKVRAQRGLSQNQRNIAIVPEPAGGIAGRAAQFLRRIAPVHSCAIKISSESAKARTVGDALNLPNHGRDHWKWLGRVITSDELIEIARRKGFEPDNWKIIPETMKARAA